MLVLLTTKTNVKSCYVTGGDTVEYSTVVSTVEDTSTTIEYSITMVVVCRDPVAQIQGQYGVSAGPSRYLFAILF